MAVSLTDIAISLANDIQTHNTREMPPRIPAPSHRHAAPSGPWPWMELVSDFSPVQPGPPPEHSLESPSPWKGYPQSLFPNWTPEQVKRSKILTTSVPSENCTIYHVDVLDDACFTDQGEITVAKETEEQFWDLTQRNRPEGIRVRALFVDHISRPVLQMLGTRYNIEPFFFSSSMNWIPSRYQEEVQPGNGDHVTITLPFIRTRLNPTIRPLSPSSERSPLPSFVQKVKIIDTQAPLPLRSTDYILLLDLLAVHMIRTPNSSTIISYHPSGWQTTSAKQLHSLLCVAGESVYWQKIFKQSDDPTFVLLAIMWYALYTWDEAIEVLYKHISWLESRVMSTNDMQLVRELHIIQAHLLHYASLLHDFRKSVAFILDTQHPCMDNPSYDIRKRQDSNDLMKKECNNLLSEIDRLERSRAMQGSRLKNVMDLAFATVNIEDSKAMKQISYLTMIFLPASFAAGVFGMNVKEISPGTHGTLGHYVVTTAVLTALTVWIIVAFQSRSPFHESGRDNGIWIRLSWPVLFLGRSYIQWITRRKQMSRTAGLGYE